jgi:hypothetical protein
MKAIKVVMKKAIKVPEPTNSSDLPGSRNLWDPPNTSDPRGSIRTYEPINPGMANH